MLVSPLAGALSDRIGRRPIMVTGLSLQALGFIWVAAHGSMATSWIELDAALLVAGIGISMALPTVPTAVLSAVAPQEMGKASGINYMAQRFGAVFAIAIASAVFSANGHLGSPGECHRRFHARAVGLCRVRRPGGADRLWHSPAARRGGRSRRGHRPAPRRLRRRDGISWWSWRVTGRGWRCPPATIVLVVREGGRAAPGASRRRQNAR